MDGISVFRSPGDRRRTVAYLVVLLAAWAGLWLFTRRQLGWLLDPDALREFLRGFGALAPLAFVVLQAAQVVVAPIPGQALGFAAGYLFGTVVGTTVSVVGATAGSYVAFHLSRRYGRSYVEGVVDPEFLATFDDIVADRGLTALFLVFFVPGLPDDVICFAAGLTDLDIEKMVAASFVGRIPGYFLVAVAGAGLARGRVVEAAVLVGALVAASGVVYLQRERVVAWLEGP